MKAKWLPLIEDGGVYHRDSGIALFLAKCFVVLLPAETGGYLRRGFWLALTSPSKATD
jgi:hypothetical protein